jgi:hypothetical protein
MILALLAPHQGRVAVALEAIVNLIIAGIDVSEEAAAEGEGLSFWLRGDARHLKQAVKIRTQDIDVLLKRIWL